MKRRPRHRGRRGVSKRPELKRAISRELHAVNCLNPIKSETLEEKYDVDKADLQRIIRDLRREGVMILSSSGRPAGYWESTDPDEIDTWADKQESRGKAVLEPVAAARRRARLLRLERDPNLANLNGPKKRKPKDNQNMDLFTKGHGCPPQN